MRAKGEMFVWFVKDYKTSRGGPEGRFQHPAAEPGPWRRMGGSLGG